MPNHSRVKGQGCWCTLFDEGKLLTESKVFCNSWKRQQGDSKLDTLLNFTFDGIPTKNCTQFLMFDYFTLNILSLSSGREWNRSCTNAHKGIVGQPSICCGPKYCLSQLESHFATMGAPHPWRVHSY